MRATHVITRLIVGGAQENTLSSVLGLRQIPGWNVDLIAGPTEGSEGTLEPLARAIPGLLTVVPELVRPVRPILDLMACCRLSALFRRTRPDIVHTHSGKAGFLGRLAARRAGVPTILHTIHGPSFGPFQGAIANGCYRIAERLAADVTTHFVVVADAMRHQYLAAGIGGPGQFTRVFSGFPLEPFLQARRTPEVAKRLGLVEGDLVVGMISRLFELKGHDDLIDIAPAVVRADPRIRFLLVGDGPWRDRLSRRVADAGLDRHFIFAGLVPPSEVPVLVGSMDLLVHLSRREGLPRALPQALAAGKAVIAYDCDGAREVCHDGRTGFLVRPGDLTLLKERLIELAGDPALRDRFGVAGRAWVRRHFAEEALVESLAELYRRLAAAAPGFDGSRMSAPDSP